MRHQINIAVLHGKKKFIRLVLPHTLSMEFAFAPEFRLQRGTKTTFADRPERETADDIVTIRNQAITNTRGIHAEQRIRKTCNHGVK
ncbi:hypothetical protein KIN20_026641 [Parelaphostrongylus tenuis]|uniref:Uncharacterized protein n=1 Tax=Parelaphostrongylus tenuis TaxID=148309 RepID=A0AAD5QYF3_PARTN|nr:hypothetical protein KIN20_026641 [Parelaphostrongylus tenuis]